jgi:hypothetical protein
MQIHPDRHGRTPRQNTSAAAKPRRAINFLPPMQEKTISLGAKKPDRKIRWMNAALALRSASENRAWTAESLDSPVESLRQC